MSEWNHCAFVISNYIPALYLREFFKIVLTIHFTGNAQLEFTIKALTNRPIIADHKREPLITSSRIHGPLLGQGFREIA